MAFALPVHLTDAVATVSSVALCSDSFRTGATDTAAVLIAFTVSDSIATSLSESASDVVTLSVSDTVSVISGESATVIDPNTASISANDALAVRVSGESFTLSSNSSVQDTWAAGFTDSVNNLQVFTGQSTNNVSVSDSLQVRLNGIEQPAPTIPVNVVDGISAGASESILYSASVLASDSCAVRATDTANAPAVSLTRTDSIQVGLTEPGDQQASFSVADSLTAQAVDAAPLISGSFSFNVTDSLSVQQSELTTFGTSTVGASDSIRAGSSESLVNSASVFASDSLTASVVEVVSTFKAITSVDSLLVQLTDSASPIFNSFVGLTASDSCAIQSSESVAELINFLRQFTITDSLAVLNVEGSADQFVTVPATEQLVSQADELLDILNTQSVAESVQIRTIESGLAIPIVSVNVSAFADDTILGAADGVASVSIVYEAFEYTVSDTCNVQGIDES